MGTDYQQRLEEALALIESQKLECARLTNEVSDLGRRCRDTEASLAETKRLLANALGELKEQEIRDKELAEFEKTLSGFEEVKRSYERKIRNLEARLRDANIKSKRAEDSDELLIDMSPDDYSYGGLFAPVIPPEPKKETPQPVSRKEPKRKTIPIPETHDFAKKSPDSANPNDWLLSLPDNL